MVVLYGTKEYSTAEIDSAVLHLLRLRKSMIAKGIQFRSAVQHLFDLIDKNEYKLQRSEEEINKIRESKLEMEQSMDLKLKRIEASSREKNLTLQNLIKRNNAYLVGTQQKIVSLTTDRDKLSANCGHWKKLCQQQSSIINRLQLRNSNIASALQSINISKTVG